MMTKLQKKAQHRRESTIKTLEKRHEGYSSVFFVDFGDSSHLFFNLKKYRAHKANILPLSLKNYYISKWSYS